MERFVITIITKRSILDAAAALDLPLIMMKLGFTSRNVKNNFSRVLKKEVIRIFFYITLIYDVFLANTLGLLLALLHKISTFSSKLCS